MTGAEALRQARADFHGFLTSGLLAAVAADDTTRLKLLLVRCGMMRALVGAQDVAHFVRCIEAGGDYVRDVSLPVDAWNGRHICAPAMDLAGAAVERCTVQS